MARQGGGGGGAEIPLSLTQRGFGGGELGPQLLGRADQGKYSTGLRLCRNMQIERHGAVVNRAGTLYSGLTKNQSASSRLRPFAYDSFNAYLAEFNAGSVRMWANGAPLSAIGCPAYSISQDTPQGQIVSNAGSYWYCLNRQFQGTPIRLTITGASYLAGAPLTVTASQSLWTADMAWTGAGVAVQIPGGPIVHLTLLTYSSSTSTTAYADIDIPANLQNLPTMMWTLTNQTFNVLSNQSGVQQVITMAITTGTTYVAGQPLTITANYPFFSNEMVSAGTVMTFPSANGPVPLTMTIFGGGTGLTVTAMSTVDIPAALQVTATNIWSIPQTVSTATCTPQGPNFPPGANTIILTATAGFGPAATLTATATVPIFNAGMVAAAQAFTFFDGLGNQVVCQCAFYTSTTVMTMVCETAVPMGLQNAATANWATSVVAPVSGPYWYQLSSNVVELPIAIPQAALASMVTSQFVNVMTITQQLFAPVQITRISVWQWVITNVASSCGILPPTGLTALIGFSSTLHLFVYYVTAVNAQDEESLLGNPVICLGNYPSNDKPNVISWSPVIGAVSYNIYGTASAQISTTVPGLIGSSATPGFNDVGNDPNVAVQAPALIPLFQTINDYPAVTSYFQQRLMFANSITHPQRTWCSQTNRFLNFTILTPTSAASAIEFDMPGQLIQPVTAIVDIGKLVLHTASNEYICTGDVTGALTGTAINPAFQGSAGCALVQPVRIGITDIFCQARGGQIRDLTYTIQSVSYSGKDLTIFNPQLFLGQTVLDMAWQNIKDSIVWCLMGSGQLYGLTYIREHEIWAWHHHDTGGVGQVTTTMPMNVGIPVVQTATTALGSDIIESIAVIPEGQNDTLYLSIRRTINGAVVRYVERMAPREFIDQAALTDAVFSDSSIIYDGRNTGATTMTLTGSSWAIGTLLTVTASTGTFDATWVGQEVVLQLYSASGVLTAEVVITILVYTSSTVVQGTADQDVPAWAQVALTTWGHAKAAFTGATNLAGMPVSVLADASVQSSPNNPAYPNPITVSGTGTFTLPFNALVVCVGLPYVAQAQTLPLENIQGETLTNKMQVVNEVTGMFYATRGGFWGMDFQHLFQWNQRSTEPLSSPVALFTGPARIPTQGTWEITGQACVALLDPLPWGLSALTVSGFTGR